MARFLLLAPLAMLAVPTDVARQCYDPRAAIRARPIPLDFDDPARVAVGGLRYRAGWVLHGENPLFGGISSMVILGRRVLALSDEGVAIGFDLPRGLIGRPLVRPLPVLGAAQRKTDRDAEAMARDPATGTLWVATEGRNEIWRFAPGFARAERRIRPMAMRYWPTNGGAESMVRLSDGRFILICEDRGHDPTTRGPPGTRVALLFAGDPTMPGPPPQSFYYAPPAGMAPSDAIELPDGRVAVLNRGASLRTGVSAEIRTFDPRTITARRTVETRTLARLARPFAIDNMEALAITRERGATMLWIASDDNMAVIQQTLLLKFELVG